MKVLAIVLLLGLACATPIDYSVVGEVNDIVGNTWVAGRNANFEGKSVEYVQHLLGWVPGPTKLAKKNFVSEFAPPAEFNSITHWSTCTSIGSIRDQGECGSCWAFGCVEAVTDRFCIASSGKVNISQLSEQEMTSCGPCMGCEGGEAGAAWQYVQEHGLVTNAAYPYKQPTCEPSQEPCLPPFKPTLPCNTPSGAKNYKLSNVYGVRSSDIQQEIMTNGPVEACFTVYEDFVHYKSGVYQHRSGQMLGGHCVKMVGWGSENGTPYWLINNSWTTTWGDKGQFKILRGQDECGIESDVVGGTPIV